MVRSRDKSRSLLWAASIGGLVVIGGLIAALNYSNSKDDEPSGTQVTRATNNEKDTKTDTPQTKTDDGKSNVDPVVESPVTPNDIAKSNGDTTTPNDKSPPEQEIDTAPPPTTGDNNANTSAAARSPAAPRFPVVSLPARDAKAFDGMQSVAGWQSNGVPTGPLKLDSVDARKLRPGLILLRFPRQAIQKQEPGAFVLPRELGSPLGAPTLARGMARLHFPTNENVLAVGYVRINEAGQYTIGGGNRFGRDTVYLLGEPLVRYSNRPGTRYTRKNLEPGYYPIALAGFADSDGHAGVNVSRRGAESGGQSVRLGDAVFYHDPSFAANPQPNPYVPGSPGQFSVERDAFSQVDIAQHVVGGNWTRTGNQISGVTEEVYGRVQIPVEVPPEYDFSFRATRSAGDGPLVVGVPYKGRLVGIAIDEWNENGVGLLQFDRKKTAGAVTFPQPSLRLCTNIADYRQHSRVGSAGADRRVRSLSQPRYARGTLDPRQLGLGRAEHGPAVCGDASGWIYV